MSGLKGQLTPIPSDYDISCQKSPGYLGNIFKDQNRIKYRENKEKAEKVERDRRRQSVMYP